jgi:hypothetical protein
LNKYCQQVYYYKRNTGISSWLSIKPYIVQSRKNKELLRNLAKNRFPILFEGLHTTCFLNHPALSNHLKIVRTHNIEHDYYQGLLVQEKNWFKRFYFYTERLKLERFEKILNHAQLIAAISPEDTKYLKKHYANVFWLPPFHPNQMVISQKGFGSIVLYHADLSVAENITAVDFLIDTFTNHPLSIVIAGRNPSGHLKELIRRQPNFILVENPSIAEMDRLIKEAHIILLPTWQATGIKLKLITSLFEGRYCIVNNDMVNQTGLESLCFVANTKEEFLTLCNQLIDQPFTIEMINQRKIVLEEQFSNPQNALRLIQLIADIVKTGDGNLK